MRPNTMAGVILASALAGQLGCSSDPAGPSLGDDVRVPLTSAMNAAQRGVYIGVPGAAHVNGLTDLVIAQLAAAGQLDRSRDDSGAPTDPISQDSYDAAAVYLQYDVVTPLGFRFSGETLNLLAWSGLDRNRGRAEALMRVSAGVRNGSLAPGSFDASGAGSMYFVADDGQVFENSPGISFDLVTLDAEAAESSCRGVVPDQVTCQVATRVGRATGSFHFFAKGISPGLPQSNFHYRDTSFDLPVTVMRLVDTLRFASAVAD